MSERKYSLSEIDRMRTLLIWRPSGAYGGSIDDFMRGVEDQLRTYMQNGTDPDELDDYVKRLMAAEQQARIRAKGQ